MPMVLMKRIGAKSTAGRFMKRSGINRESRIPRQPFWIVLLRRRSCAPIKLETERDEVHEAKQS